MPRLKQETCELEPRGMLGPGRVWHQLHQPRGHDRLHDEARLVPATRAEIGADVAEAIRFQHGLAEGWDGVTVVHGSEHDVALLEQLSLEVGKLPRRVQLLRVAKHRATDLVHVRGQVNARQLGADAYGDGRAGPGATGIYRVVYIQFRPALIFTNF